MLTLYRVKVNPREESKMKKLLAVFAAVFALTTGASASAVTQEEFARNLILAEMQQSIANGMQTFNLINWKVGENATYDMKAMIGSIGKMQKSVASEQGNAIWV